MERKEREKEASSNLVFLYCSQSKNQINNLYILFRFLNKIVDKDLESIKG